MTASSSQLKVQEDIAAQTASPLEEAMPVIHSSHGKPFDIMAEYLGDDIRPPTEFHRSRFTIFGKDIVTNISQKVFDIARAYVLPAAPLDLLEIKVRENPNVLLPTIKITTSENVCLKGNLEELAAILLDNDIRTKCGIVHEGMSARLRRLRKELLPDTMPRALEQAKIASPDEKRKEEEARESQLLTDIFERIKDNKSDAKIEIKTYIESIKPEVINSNRYYLNLFQLHNEAFAVISRRVEDLKYPGNHLFVTQAYQFGFKVIATIQEAFPNRLRQLLNHGASRLSENILRKIDNEGRDFLGGPRAAPDFSGRTVWKLGVDHFYHSAGRNPGNTSGDFFPEMVFGEESVNAFNTLLQIIRSAAIQLSSDIEIQSNYVARNVAIAAANAARRRGGPSCRD